MSSVLWPCTRRDPTDVVQALHSLGGTTQISTKLPEKVLPILESPLDEEDFLGSTKLRNQEDREKKAIIPNTWAFPTSTREVTSPVKVSGTSYSHSQHQSSSPS